MKKEIKPIIKKEIIKVLKEDYDKLVSENEEYKKTLKEFSDWFKKEFYGDDDISTEIYDKIMDKLKEFQK